MSRLLFLLAVIVVVFLLLRAYRRKAPRQQDAAAEAEAEEMVRCAKCGVHLPKSESILAGGNFYCSDAHRREHTSK
ncbi:MAG: hypothetical protein HZB95_04600 [Nitrosomonadales bacterium]|nr:hypothetical protein [Nitrosomonadales bacterium]